MIILIYVGVFLYFVNGEKSAGIFCKLVQINKWNSEYKGKHHTLWGACFVKTSPVWHKTSSRYKWHALATARHKKKRCPGYKCNFMTKY